MRAIVTTGSGPPEVLKLKEVETPVPKHNEVLIRIHAATVTSGDVILRKLHPVLVLLFRLFGMRRKRIPGHELAGEIVAVGKEVKRFVEGDQVFGTTTGLSVGSNTEYVCLPEDWPAGVLAIKPVNMTYEEAAALPIGGLTALHFLRAGNVRAGQKVLVYGASGSVGTFAVQLAKHLGAEVTGVCSTANLEWVKSLGSDQVIDYTRELYANGGELYDLIFDAVGKTSLSKGRKALTSNGTYVSVRNGEAKERTEDLVHLRDLIEAGRIRSVIDRRYPLERVPEAHRYVEAGHKKGNVVIYVDHDDIPGQPAAPGQ